MRAGAARGGGWGRLSGRQRHVSVSCREELPAIYKCPYQGCTAVYRGADGMKVRSGGAAREDQVSAQSPVQTPSRGLT